MSDPVITRSEVGVDHVIFYAAEALDALAAFFERLGFTLTPLGRHDSGSVNRLAILENQYIELMAFDPGTPPTVRPELRAMAPGLNGIVVADKPELGRVLNREPFNAPVNLARPLADTQSEQVARFTITAVREAVPDVRIFLCRHHTPELVWQDRWKEHANRAVALSRISIATRHPDLLHRAIQTAFDFRGSDNAPFYDAAGTQLDVLPAGSRSVLTVRTANLAPVVAQVRRHELHHTMRDPHQLTVHLPAPYDADLTFTSINNI